MLRNIDCGVKTVFIVAWTGEQKHGECHAKPVILEIYDAMQQAIDTGRPCQALLDPPPGPPTDPAGNFIPMAHWDPDDWPKHIHRARE